MLYESKSGEKPCGPCTHDYGLWLAGDRWQRFAKRLLGRCALVEPHIHAKIYHHSALTGVDAPAAYLYIFYAVDICV